MWCAVAAAITVILDQFTKALAVSRLQGAPVSIVSGVIELRLTRNPGSAFGLATPSWVAIAVSVVVCVVVLLYLTRGGARSGARGLVLGMVVGGALGNLVDRIRMGAVIDFIDLRVWPVFNVADIAITVGVGLLMIEVIRHK
jgi:signal peptidase II